MKVYFLLLFVFTFVRVIGLPSEEDWPADSPISYSIHWGQKCLGTKLLHNLEPDENHLLSVSGTAFLTFNFAAKKIKCWSPWMKSVTKVMKTVFFPI